MQPWYDRRQVRYDNFAGPSHQASTRQSAGFDRFDPFWTGNPAIEIDKADLRSKNTFYPWEASCAASKNGNGNKNKNKKSTSFAGQANDNSTQPHEEVVSLPAIRASVKEETRSSVQDAQLLLGASE